METFLYLFVHYGLPAALLLYYIFVRFDSKIGLLATTLFSVSIVFFLYLWGQWAIVGSYYLRYLMIAAILVFIYLFYVKNKSINSKEKNIGFFKKLRISIVGIITLYVIFICVKILFSNNNYQEDAVSLEFPLIGGEFYISSGGANGLMNNHLRDKPSPQQYAIDINKLNNFKSISKNILSKENADHYIYSDTVYCPCTGTIEKIKDQIEDNLLSSMDVSRRDGTGNYIYLKCDDIYVYMLHLKKNSLLVSKGAEVEAGSPLALVGNSGFSQEPHLHIQASKFNSDSTLVGVPIKFNSRILTKNDLFEN
jgi:hypothetical protein